MQKMEKIDDQLRSDEKKSEPVSVRGEVTLQKVYLSNFSIYIIDFRKWT